MSDTNDPKPTVDFTAAKAMDTLAKLKQGIAVSNDEFPMEATPRERRKYAILQAAATMIAGHWPYLQVGKLVQDAREILAEIERQEEA